ncbi:MAG: alpha/beta hydrolase [Patescibacteria group bacterium]
MKKRVFIIHGWEGYPEEAWFPWLKHELEEKEFEVVVPQMPNADAPSIDVWIPFLHTVVGKCDANTFFVGHSIGCQTILRYLEILPPQEKIGGAVLVAGWVSLTPIATRTPEEQTITRPWLEAPIDYEKIKTHTKNFVGIFSDNDPYVPPENQITYREKLNARIAIIPGRGHFNEESNTKEFPDVLHAILGMVGVK